MTIWSGRWLDREGLQNKVVAIRDLNKRHISGVVVNRWANQGINHKLRIGLIFRDSQFEVRNDARPSFAQANRSRLQVYRIRYQSPLSLLDEIGMLDERRERIEESHRFMDKVQRLLVVRSARRAPMSKCPVFLK